MPGDVTLDDVARSSGVSRATASRALNGRAGVKDGVRRRVEIAARELGYRPNRAARNLAGGRAALIGLVLGNRELREAPYETAILQHVAREADQKDEGLMLLLDTKEPSESVRRLLGDGLVDGVIVSVVALGSRWVEELLDARIPTVLIGFHPNRRDVTVVEVENRESSAEIVGHLLDTGCKRVGTISGHETRTDANDRLEGYRLAFDRRSIEVDESLIVQGDFGRGSGYRLADTLFDRGVDGIFAANDEMAIGAYLRATERGISIPDELSLAGFDGLLSSPNEIGLLTGQPRITSAVQPFQELAATAIDSLIAAIRGESTPKNQIIRPEIFYGDTTRISAT